MKRIFLLLMLFFSSMLQAQTLINRAGQANTVQDARLAALYNFILPRYTDTTQANTVTNIGPDSCGALIYIRSTGKIYKRLCSPKKWQEIFTETDPFFTISPAYYITDARITHWDSTYLWGNHAIAGYASTTALTDSITDLKSAIALKVNITDTASMMAAAPRVQRFLDSVTNIKTSIATKTNTSDTAAMMAAAPRVQRFLDSVTNIKTSIATKTNNSDTAAMMAAAPRVQRFLDSITNVKISIAAKTNNSDTAAMMAAAPRVQRFLDSVANIKTSISTKQNTLTLTTTGTSGASTLVGSTLNIPQYTGGNIYNTDGTVTGARTVTLGTNIIKFTGTGASGISIENNIANTAPTMLSLLNNGTGGGTGAKIVFPWSSSITSTFNGGYVFNAQGVDVLTALGNGVTIPTNALTFSGSAPALISHSSTASGTFTLKTGGNILFQNYTGSFDTRLKINQTTGNVIIQDGGTFSDVTSARLQINSTTQGFLPPRMTTTQINAISSPAVGLVVYNTTLNVLCVFIGIWHKITTTIM